MPSKHQPILSFFPHTAPSMARSRAGFSIVEIAVVLVVAGLVVTLAMPRVDTPGRRLNEAAREGSSALLHARQQAIVLQHDVLVDFDTAAALIRVTHDADNDGVRDAGERIETHRFEDIGFGRGAASGGPAGIATVSFSPPDSGAPPRLVFHRDGSASAFGGFYLRTARAGSAAYADEVRAITVDRPTGRVSAFRPDDSRWERLFLMANGPSSARTTR